MRPHRNPSLTQSYGERLARESELLLIRQRQQRVLAQLAQLEGELTQLAADEEVMVGAQAEAAELELEAELEPEAKLGARMIRLAEVRSRQALLGCHRECASARLRPPPTAGVPRHHHRRHHHHHRHYRRRV